MSNKWNEDLRRRMEQYEAPIIVKTKCLPPMPHT